MNDEEVSDFITHRYHVALDSASGVPAPEERSDVPEDGTPSYLTHQYFTDDFTLSDISLKALTYAIILVRVVPRVGDCILFVSYPDLVAASVVGADILSFEAELIACQVRWEIWF